MILFCQLGPPVILYIVSSALFTANQKWVWGFHQELCSRLFLWCFKTLGYFKVPAERGIAPSGPSLLSLLIGKRLPWSGGKENRFPCAAFSLRMIPWKLLERQPAWHTLLMSWLSTLQPFSPALCAVSKGKAQREVGWCCVVEQLPHWPLGNEGAGEADVRPSTGSRELCYRALGFVSP